MTWTKLSDDFTDRLADDGLSRSARLLLVEMYVYGNRRTLDGRIPLAALPRLTDSTRWRDELEELRETGRAEISGGTVVIDWSDQEPRAVVEERQRYSREKQARYRRRKMLHEAGDHSECRAPFCTSVTESRDRNSSGNSDGHITGRVTPSRPARPVPPEGQGQGQDADAGRRADALADTATEDDEPRSPHRFIAPIDSPAHCSICGGSRAEHPIEESA